MAGFASVDWLNVLTSCSNSSWSFGGRLTGFGELYFGCEGWLEDEALTGVGIFKWELIFSILFLNNICVKSASRKRMKRAIGKFFHASKTSSQLLRQIKECLNHSISP
jgi:hypothetical protein